MCFNRRREANPLATWYNPLPAQNAFAFQSQTRSQSPGDGYYVADEVASADVSIADAKPIPWRLSCRQGQLSWTCVFQSQTRSQSPGDSARKGSLCARLFVSIADAKPIPWRPLVSPVVTPLTLMFQSQTRSQSPGDSGIVTHVDFFTLVSIADAKPIPWRRLEGIRERGDAIRVSIADAKPIPWRRRLQTGVYLHQLSFNRRREANPLATN